MAKDELVKLGDIEHTLILFLRQVKNIIIDNKVTNKLRQIKRLDLDGKIEIQELTESIVKHSYKLVKNNLNVPEYIQEEKRENVKLTELILAFSLQEDGTADTRLEQKVFAFLPTRSYGFKFLIQADFLVPANREDIHKDTRWNKWIRDNIAATFLSAVEEFKQDIKLNKNYYNYIPLTHEVKDEFFIPVVNEIYNKLKVIRCILTESEKWQIPSQIVQADEQIRGLISNNDLQQLLNKEYIHPEVKAKMPILETLGVKKLSLDDLLQCLQNSEWVKKQNDTWFINLYIYLKNCNITDLSKLKNLKIIPLENNKLASTQETLIFFPLKDKGIYGFEFEQELQFIKITLIESTIQDSKNSVIEFLKKLGLQNASPYEIIENYILPIYQGSFWESKGDQLLGYIFYIKDNLEEYEKEFNKKTNPYSWSYYRKDPLENLKVSLRIKTDKNSYLRPNEVYIPASYGNENNLEKLLSGIQDVWFVSPEYIQHITHINDASEKAEKIKEWKNFFVKLGVHTLPKVNKEVHIVSHRSNKKNIYTHDYCIYSSSHILKIIEINNVEKNKRLAEILDSNWSYYKQLKQWSNYYYGSDARWHPYQFRDSDWFAKIKTAAWLPTTNGSLAKPLEIFQAEPETVSILGDSVPYLAIALNNQDFIKDLGIKVRITDLKDYADWLFALSRKPKLNEKDETILLKIYQQLNNSAITSEDWWSKFVSQRIFWTNQENFCTANNVLINDNEEIYDLFKDNPQIAFLKIPPFYYLKLQHFIKATGIRYISQIIKTELAIEQEQRVEEERLTEQIKSLIPYALRYLYQLEHQTYEQLKSNQTLVQLKNLVCYRVKNLKIKYLLNEQSACTQRSAFLYNGNLYIQADSLSNTDYLALEISKLFGCPKGMDEFLVLLFDKRTPDKIESYMRIKNIQPLPAEEKQWFESSSIYLAETHFIGITEATDKNVEFTDQKHHKIDPDQISAKSQSTNVYQNDQAFATEDIYALEIDTQWEPECDPREVKKIEALQWPQTIITSQEYLSTERVNESIITPSITELIEHETVLGQTTFSKSKSELASNQPIFKLIRELQESGQDELSEGTKPSGIWGEKFAVEYLRRKFSAKYPTGELEEDQYGFLIKIKSQVVVEVQWLNKVHETAGYDIKLIEKSREDYIEVKSSKPGAKKLIKLSGIQWKLAHDLGDNFHIYRVYDAGTQHATLIDISNPSQLWLEGSLRVNSVYLRI
ncbi:DUF3883 domain-containing protein [Nostoc sp. FACHB-152]|uniref:DUF3883 domain-containing protein n=1 Tax=Nostoc sp. FACHB-152 TaxID=2692837 RepID=UPI0016865D15|nr:DUF3883 domain-containing protein [Nostoc sp. FACHB-152]MBD2452249.1 DUF3883 domain-containing protein [Nostoc sp. FACHB-152]